jgi:methyl-accepting chemotaxis protein
MLSDYVALWNDYRQASASASALAAAGKDAEALAALRRAKPAYERSHDKLVELDEFQKKVALESSDRALETYHRATWLSIIGVGVAVAVMAAILIMLVRSVAAPIGTMTNALDRLAQGDLKASVPADDRRDEVGKLATATVTLRDQLAAAERAKQEQANLIVDSIGDGLDKLAQGDLTVRVEAELTGVFAKLKTDFNNAMEALSRTLGAVSQATGGVHTGASEISQASDDLSRRTEQQAASLEETAAAMDQITATVRESAENAARANKAAALARGEAEQSGTVVSRAIEAMAGIERASAEISEIISVIDGIAFQTNLLALNAGVEAARAGDAGKGFAVVASEVRALAQRSAEAARDVKARITASSEQVEAGVSLVSETGAALNRIIAAVAEVDGLVADIAGAAQQQAAGLQQVNTAVTEMDGVTQQNAAMVEEATAASRSLAAEADQLAQHIGRFRLGAQPVAAAPSNPVHKLQARAGAAASAPTRASRPATRGNTALAVAVEDDWSEF